MTTDEILNKWRERAKSTQDCHYDTAASLKKRHLYTGLPLVILSAIAGSSAFNEVFGLVSLPASLSDYTPEKFNLLVLTVLTLIITVLSAAQAFLGSERRGAEHYIAGTRIGDIKRRLELISLDSGDAHKVKQQLDAIRQEWNDLLGEAPQIPESIWKQNAARKNKGPSLLHVLKMRLSGSA